MKTSARLYASSMLSFILLVLLLACIPRAQSHEAVNPLQGQPQGDHGGHARGHGGPPSGQRPPPPGQHGAPVGQGARGGSNGHGGGHPGAPVHVMDHNAVHDQEHLREHMAGKVEMGEAKLSEEEMQFHYFKVHDYDNNNKLDGIEIISALTHHHREPEAQQGKQEDRPADMTEKEIGESVDSILLDNDANRDGYIDYAEFIIAQRSEEGGR